MAEWEGWLILLSFTFVTLGVVSFLVLVRERKVLNRLEWPQQQPRLEEWLVEYEKIESSIKRWNWATHVFFALFFVTFVLTFIIHANH